MNSYFMPHMLGNRLFEKESIVSTTNKTTTSKLIPTVWGVPETFNRRLGDRAGKQRAMVHEGHLLLVLHDPPASGDKTRQARLFYRRPDGVWSTTADGNGTVGLQKHLERFEQLIETLDLREDRAVTADEYFKLTEEILPLKRASVNLLATLDDARKQVPEARELILLRDHAYDISRSAELLSEAIKIGGELAQTRRAEEQAMHAQSMAVSAHRLNLLVAFFFPLASMATVFGMNLSFGWEEQFAPIPFLAVCGLGMVLGLLLVVSIFRRPEIKR